MLTLSPDELRALTGHRRSDAQRRELEHMRVPFRVRRDGSLVVLAADVCHSRGTIAPAEPELQP